jgi:hypothetical protein
VNFNALGVKLKPFLKREEAKTGHQRTRAVTHAFLDLIKSSTFSALRPDQIWTGLNHAFIINLAEPELKNYHDGKIGTAELIDKLHSIRQGWAKSSGTAFEYFLVDRFDSILEKQSPRMRLLSKTDKQLRALHPTNLSENELGENKIDDLYLLVQSGHAWIIFCMISAQASGGDRWLRGEQRCNSLRTSGVNCINITLDPRQVSRSPNGNMLQPDYLRRFQQPNPPYNAHFILDKVDEEVSLPDSIKAKGGTIPLCKPSRIFRTDLRAEDCLFLKKTKKAALEFLRSKSLASTYNW